MVLPLDRGLGARAVSAGSIGRRNFVFGDCRVSAGCGGVYCPAPSMEEPVPHDAKRDALVPRPGTVYGDWGWIRKSASG